jgi:hypothetical protein
MPMTPDAREAFLAETHRIATITIDRPSRAPLAVPVWYDYTPGGDVRVWMDRGTRKERLLRTAGRLSLTVHTDELPYKYVTVEGPVTWNETPTPEDVAPVAARYLSPADVGPYVRLILGPTSVVVHLRPEQWLSADLTSEWEELWASFASTAT